MNEFYCGVSSFCYIWGVCVTYMMCSQRTTCKSQFSSFTLWGPDIKLGFSGIMGSATTH